MEYDFKQAKVGVVTLAYVERGQGAPVVLVHGSGATDLRTWGQQLQSFDGRYRIFAYSRRCHYPNPWIGDGSEINDIAVQAADLAALITTLRVGRVHLVGSSFGADIALRAAVDYPGMLRTVTVAEPGLFDWLVTLPGGAALFARFTEAIGPARYEVSAGNPEAGVKLWLDSFMEGVTFDELPPSLQERVMANVRHIGHEPISLDDVSGGVSREEVNSVRVPVLLLRGDESAPTFQLVMDELERVLPGAERATVERASHLLHVMNPAGFNAAVVAFLAKHSGRLTGTRD